MTDKDKISVTLTFDRQDIEAYAEGFQDGDLTEEQFQSIKKNIEGSASYFMGILEDNSTIANLVEEEFYQ